MFCKSLSHPLKTHVYHGNIALRRPLGPIASLGNPGRNNCMGLAVHPVTAWNVSLIRHQNAEKRKLVAMRMPAYRKIRNSIQLTESLRLFYCKSKNSVQKIKIFIIFFVVCCTSVALLVVKWKTFGEYKSINCFSSAMVCKFRKLQRCSFCYQPRQTCLSAG